MKVNREGWLAAARARRGAGRAAGHGLELTPCLTQRGGAKGPKKPSQHLTPTEIQGAAVVSSMSVSGARGRAWKGEGALPKAGTTFRLRLVHGSPFPRNSDRVHPLLYWLGMNSKSAGVKQVAAARLPLSLQQL